MINRIRNRYQEGYVYKEIFAKIDWNKIKLIGPKLFKNQRIIVHDLRNQKGKSDDTITNWKSVEIFNIEETKNYTETSFLNWDANWYSSNVISQKDNL